MEFLREIEKLNKDIIFPCLTVFILLALFFFTFGPGEILPIPSQYSFSVLFFEQIRADLIPAEVELIAINPLSAFLAQIIISLCLAFIVGFPFFLYKFIKYLSPAFSKKEKSKIVKAWIPSLFLFILGCLFAYFVLIPITLRILYQFPITMGVRPYFVINEFILFVIMLLLVSGIMFLLPIFMVLLSRLGLVKKSFWKDNWRYAILFFLLFSAIITPDGSGITMFIFSAPLSCLYFLGYYLTTK